MAKPMKSSSNLDDLPRTAAKPEAPAANPAHRQSPRLTVFNTSGREVGTLVDGNMYAVPAGMPGGGHGTLVCPRFVAEALLAAHPDSLTLSPAGYGAADVARMRALPEAAAKAFAEALMRGGTPPVEAFEPPPAGAAAKDGKPLPPA